MQKENQNDNKSMTKTLYFDITGKEQRTKRKAEGINSRLFEILFYSNDLAAGCLIDESETALCTEVINWVNNAASLHCGMPETAFCAGFVFRYKPGYKWERTAKGNLSSKNAKVCGITQQALRNRNYEIYVQMVKHIANLSWYQDKTSGNVPLLCGYKETICRCFDFGYLLADILTTKQNQTNA